MASVTASPEYMNSVLYEQRMAEIQAERLARYRKAWEYYNGRHKLPLPVQPGATDDNVIINLVRLVVDKGASFLFGKELKMEIQEGVTTDTERALSTVWQRNNKMTFLTKLATSGGIFGHVFVQIVPDGLGEGVPRLINLAPEYMTVYWDDADIEFVYKYVLQWQGTGRDGRMVERRHTFALEDGGDTWRIVYEMRRGRRWELDPERESVDWAWPFPPIAHCQNLPLPGTFYGSSDIEDVRLQDALNYVASKIQRIIRYHAHPILIATGVRPDDVQVAEDETLFLPSPESALEALEMRSDMSGALAFLDRIINWELAIARIPRIDPAVINVGALSGFALKVLYGDLLEKTEMKRRTYGDMIVEINRRLLAIMGAGDDIITALHWPDPLPEDEQAEMTRDKFEIDYNLASIETVRVRRGLDHEVEQQRIMAQKAAEGDIGAILLRNWQTQRGTGAQE